VRIAPRPQAAFGPPREEPSKFAPTSVARGDRIVVKGSTANGGPAASALSEVRRRIDPAARPAVAAELDHSRREISRTYPHDFA